MLLRRRCCLPSLQTFCGRARMELESVGVLELNAERGEELKRVKDSKARTVTPSLLAVRLRCSRGQQRPWSCWQVRQKSCSADARLLVCALILRANPVTSHLP